MGSGAGSTRGASAVREEDGAIRRWFGSSSDVAEIVEARRHLEERVAERTRELEDSLEERARAEAALAQAHRLETVGRLTGGVADFNNLLTVVIGGLDMILKNPADTARVERLSEAALAAGRRGERLTRQLAFSRRRAEAGGDRCGRPDRAGRAPSAARWARPSTSPSIANRGSAPHVWTRPSSRPPC